MTRRTVVTGSSGYLGSLLIKKLLDQGTTVLGIDTAPSVVVHDGYRHLTEDVGSQNIEQAVVGFNPDSIIHAAFVFQPMRNQRKMRDFNIGAFENLLQIVGKIKPAIFHVVSSATVYGTAKQRTEPLTEHRPFHSSRFQYAKDKQEIEDRLPEFVDKHKDIATSWSRPCLIGGPNIDNYMSRFIFGMPFLPLADGNDTPLQFVHEDDVVSAILRVVSSGQSGPFNIGPNDSSRLSEIADRSGRRAISLPHWLCYGAHWLAWHSRFPIHESPPALLEFARYPWLIDSSRLVRELGFQFRYSSDQTLDIMIEHMRR